ncbi:MAG: galactosyldiacylglycerol synthase [Chloroflexi bacterium HGW-Chloroflexi-2]|jgi:1,2-diacylglycerol 3-beta-galactosyltransferase|nr:MAG: galactosyldiacylglycerol synthase [Chloroflexi bacterium HGW-Chloroflexi-2]
MTHSEIKPPHVLFLFSDTGGGHRSAAEAIIEAINLDFQNRISTEMVDFFKTYAPPPFDLASDLYPPMARIPDVWKFGYKLSDDPQRTRIFYNLMWPYIRRAIYRMLNDHPYNLLVTVHPVPVFPVSRAMKSGVPPFFTVVTDMVSTHTWWFNQRSDLIFVPTEIARQRGLAYGLKPDQIRVVGLPVAQRFCMPSESSQFFRDKMGWPQNLLVILLIGGGDGMGPLTKVARAISDAHLNAALVIVTGRNHKLKAQLEAEDWSLPTFIYGFTHEMPNFMRSADILLTKAGPGTISEAFISSLPMILYSRMPGQEDGNVSYVVNQGAGVWAPEPNRIIEVLRDWLDHPDEREKIAANSRRLARLDASHLIAHAIADQLGVTEEIIQRISENEK